MSDFSILFSGEQQAGELKPLVGVHLPDNFQHPFRGDLDAVRQIFFYRHRAGLGGTDVLRIEVCFQLLGQIQPGLVLRVGVGVHQDARGGMTGVALHGLDVAAGFDQLVSSTGVPLRYNYDKPDKPRISRFFGYLARFFILFQTEKSSREVVVS